MSVGLRQRRTTSPAADDRSPWHAVLHAAIAGFLALHVVAAIALALLFVNMAAWVLPGTALSRHPRGPGRTSARCPATAV